MVRQAVGQNNPVLLGKKLTTKYFAGPNYVEVTCLCCLARCLSNHWSGVDCGRLPFSAPGDIDLPLIYDIQTYASRCIRSNPSSLISICLQSVAHVVLRRRALKVDIDVGSSTTAASVVGLVAGAVKSLVIDMAIVLQARRRSNGHSIPAAYC